MHNTLTSLSIAFGLVFVIFTSISCQSSPTPAKKWSALGPSSEPITPNRRSSSKLEKKFTNVQVPWNKRSSRVIYEFTPAKTGASRKQAILILGFNIIGGELAEFDQLRTRYPNHEYLHPAETHQEHGHTYHVYTVRDSDTPPFKVWFDATDYQGVF